MKLLEENLGRTLFGINHSNILYVPHPTIMERKTKINEWDLINFKKLLYNEGNYKQGEKTILRMGENNSKWNNWHGIFQNTQATHIAQYQKNKQPNLKVGKDLNRHFSKEDIQMAKRYSTSLIIREMQIKTTMKYHLTLVRMAIIKKSTNNKC